MMKPALSESELMAMDRQYAYDNAYSAICPRLSRGQRRSAYGKMLIAQAEAAGLKAENEVLRKQLESGW